jgi:predicted permease
LRSPSTVDPIVMPFQAVIPLFAYVLFGLVLRIGGIVNAELGTVIFRFVFVATLPALVFTSIATAPIDSGSARLPVAGFLTNALCAGAAFLYSRWQGLDRKQSGALILCAGVINMMMVFPFVLAFAGDDGLTVAILFDIGNAVFVATFAYTIAIYHGREADLRWRASVNEFLRSPIFIALFAALTVNLSEVEVPGLVLDITRPLGVTTMPLVLIALGISLSRLSMRAGLPVVTVGLRMGGGLIVGTALTVLFGFDDLTAWVVLASATAPVGAGAVSLVALGNLDIEQATKALSISLMLGLLTLTGLLSLAARLDFSW